MKTLLLMICLLNPLPGMSQAFVTLERSHNAGSSLWQGHPVFDSHDPTPNPCYQSRDCHVTARLYKKQGVSGGATNVGGARLWWNGGVGGISSYATIGAWARTLTAPGYIDTPYLYAWPATTCLAVSVGPSTNTNQLLISNCAQPGDAPVPSCTLYPDALNIPLRGALGGTAPSADVGDMGIRCDRPASVRISNNRDESIALDGPGGTYALLDYGAGFGRPRTMDVPAGTAWPIPLRVKIVGFEHADAGVHTGSTVVSLSYD